MKTYLSVIISSIILVASSFSFADDQTHFNTESVKPGVVFARGYRTQAEIDLDWTIFGDTIPAGSEHAALYDAAKDGVCMPIHWGYGLGQLKANNEFTATGGEVWIQYEVQFDSAFYNYSFDPAYDLDGMKTFRVFTVPATCNNEDRFFTPAWINDNVSYRVECGGFTYNTKPGYPVPADKWIRVTAHFDFPNHLYEVHWTDIETDAITNPVYEINPSSLTGIQINKAAIELHSTSRNASSGDPHPDFCVWSRNVIVSTDEIALVTAGVGTNTYYVDADAADGGDGSTTGLSGATAAFNQISDIPALSSGDTVYLNMDDTWAETLTISDSGTSGDNIVIDRYGTGTNDPQIRQLNITGDFVTVNHLIIDGEGGDFDLVSPDGDNISLANLTIRHGGRDGIDISGADDLSITDCTIYRLLRGTDASPIDAHGITGSTVPGGTITITGTEIYKTTGDGIQFDPNRGATNPSNGATINISDCTIWTSPLESADITYFTGWNVGDKVGESAIDIKVDNTAPFDQTLIYDIENITVYGYDDWARSSLRSGFNLPENCTVTIDGATVYNNEYAFRFRGVDGSPDITVMNAVLYDNDYHLRTEDDLIDLKMYNNTFGAYNTGHYFEDGTQTIFTGWDLRNNAFLGTKPTRFSDTSNKTVDSTAFNDSANDDYTLSGTGSDLYNTGTTIAAVTVDRDETSRPIDTLYDVGAYENDGIPTVLGTEILVNGVEVEIEFNETIVTTSYTSGDFNIDCTTAGADIGLSSPSGSGSTRIFSIPAAIRKGDVCNIDFAPSGADSVEDSSGNDVVTFSDDNVLNSSTFGLESNISGAVNLRIN